MSAEGRPANAAALPLEGLVVVEFTHIVIVQPVAGIDPQPGGSGQGGTVDEALEFAMTGAAGRIGEGAGVQLDEFGPEVGGRADLVRVGINEEADHDAVVLQPADGRGEGVAMGEAIESALGRHLLTAFRHEARIVGPDLQGDG